MQLLAIDLGKRSFHVHGIDDDGVIVSRRVGRAKLEAVVEELDPSVIAMEACATAHHWGRTFEAAGRMVRLINPRFVKPFARGSKNDAVDAEAIFDAASRPGMRCVPVKTVAQQDLQSLHRARDRIVASRTSLINHIRGLMAEYGLILPAGAKLFARRARACVEDAALTAAARETFETLLDELDAVETRIGKLDRRLESICQEDDTCRRLLSLPGVGPVVATALVASVGDASQFRSGRELAAWIGLVPRQYSTGGKSRLAGIGRRANHYLRRLLIHGARAVAMHLGEKADRRSRWFRSLIERRGFNRGIVGMANKTARLAWLLMTRKETYAPA